MMALPRQKNKTVPTLIAVALVVGCLLFWGKLGLSIPLTNPEQLAQQRRVMLLYHTDYEGLLEAGREVLRRGPRDPMKYRPVVL